MERDTRGGSEGGMQQRLLAGIKPGMLLFHDACFTPIGHGEAPIVFFFCTYARSINAENKCETGLTGEVRKPCQQLCEAVQVLMC